MKRVRKGNPSTAKTIIWAVDPFERETKPSKAALQSFWAWVASQDAAVQPVYVATPTTADLSLGYIAPVRDLEKRVDRFMKNLGFTSALPGKVIVDETSSRGGAVQRLLQLASRDEADCIVLSSHGRSGLSRFMLGSFAESLLRESKVPVLFLSQRGFSAEAPQGTKNIIFATDFSENSRVAFRKFLQQTKLSGCQVTLFHSVVYPVPHTAGAVAYMPGDYFEEKESWARKSAAAWIEEAKAFGASAGLLVRDGGTGFVTGTAILKVAKDLGAVLIAMASTSGLLDRALFGSAAFEVFKARSCPVLIYGPGSLRRAQSEQRPEQIENLARSGS